MATRGRVRSSTGVFYHTTKTRALDRRYDPIYRDHQLKGDGAVGYHVALQQVNPCGWDRPFFFQTPHVIDVTVAPAEVVLERVVQAVSAPAHSTARKVEAVGNVDRGVQTMRRESEAQCEPWLPDTTENTKPRAWFEDEDLEKLPLAERQKRLVELEAQQWAKRDKQITALQQARLDLLMQQFQAREDAGAEARAARVRAVLLAAEEKRQKQVAQTEQKRLKVLRTLTEQRRHMTSRRPTRRDIVAQYADSGSAPYAPLRRDGRASMPAWQHPAVRGKRDIETSLDADSLTLLEQSAAPSAVTLKMAHRKGRLERQHEAMLDTVERALLEKAGGIEKKMPTLRIAQRIEKPPPRPPTPRAVAAVDEPREQAVILLQRLLRGRALQMEMYQALEKHRQLIRELRTVEALRAVQEKAETEEEKQAATAARSAMEGAALTAGATIGEMLHFLNNQLQRRLEERRLDAAMKLAERERRRREAEEAGRREEELRVQALENEAFRRVMGANYETADAYLEAIINESVDVAASDLATEIAKRDAETITKFTTTAATATQDPVVVARDLVSAFLFPEIDREALRARLRLEQRLYRRAAQVAVETLSGS